VTAIHFVTEDGLTLEGELREAGARPRGTAVLCHPHPRHGGSKDHPLLWALRNELAATRGFTVLAFNFRGVMGSEGAYGGGPEELQDVAAAVDRVRQEASGPTILVGWSFGAWVALGHTLRDERVAATTLVGMPLGAGGGNRDLPTLRDLEDLQVPVLLVAGDADPICPVPDLRNFAGWIAHAETVVVEGADHFFGRREREVAAIVGDWFDRVLPPDAAQASPGQAESGSRGPGGSSP
jgi:alpha/beta superfamily hydrolase